MTNITDYTKAKSGFERLVTETQDEGNLNELLKTLTDCFQTYSEDTEGRLDTTIHISYPTQSHDREKSIVIEGLERAKILDLITYGYQLIEEELYKEQTNE